MSIRRALSNALRRRPAKAPTPPRSRRIHLKDGVQFGAVRYDSLDFAPLDESDRLPLSLVRPGNVGDALAFASRLSGVPFEALQTLTMDDAADVVEAMTEWLLSENVRYMRANPKWPS